MATYGPPLDQLLTLGDRQTDTFEWADYGAMGIGPEHVPALVAMLDDPAFDHDDEDDPSSWTPLHVWRALGQLRAEAAVGPLIAYLTRFLDHDWPGEEIPVALGLIGPAAVAPLAEALAAAAREANVDLAGAIARALQDVAEGFPATRDEVLRIFSLALSGDHDVDVNTLLVWRMLRLRAVEHAPAIEAAFAADRVRSLLIGDWEDAQITLGLLKKRVTPVRLPDLSAFDHLDDVDNLPPVFDGPIRPRSVAGQAQEKRKGKERKKEQKKSRKANRRKKR